MNLLSIQSEMRMLGLRDYRKFSKWNLPRRVCSMKSVDSFNHEQCYHSDEFHIPLTQNTIDCKSTLILWISWGKTSQIVIMIIQPCEYHDDHRGYNRIAGHFNAITSGNHLSWVISSYNDDGHLLNPFICSNIVLLELSP